jgi:hypothetical protein
MTPMAHPAPARRYSCPGCATCRASARRDRLLALAVFVVFVAVFVVPAVLRWHG